MGPRQAQRAGLYPYAFVYHNTTQSLLHNTDTTLTFNTVVDDYEGLRNVSAETQLKVSREGGLFLIESRVEFASHSTGYRYTYYQKNGTGSALGFTALAAVNGTTTDVLARHYLDLVVGDYVIVVAKQTSGGALNVGYAELMLTRLGLYT